MLTNDRFGFAKYYDVRDSEMCIRGFYKLGYEVGFARVRKRGDIYPFPLLTCHRNRLIRD